MFFEEEKERRDDKAFLFIISFGEIIPYINELELENEDEILDEYEAEKGKNKNIVLDGLIDNESRESAMQDIISKVIKSRKVEPRKGDIILLRFMRTDRFYFWEGMAIPIIEERVPPDFKIPDFPVNYWATYGLNDFYYDTSDMNLFECNHNSTLTLYEDRNSGYYIILRHCENKDETLRNFKETGKSCGVFHDNGNIRIHEEMGDLVDDKLLKWIYGYILSRGGDPSDTIYVNKNE
jgi:hypothetical protein